MADTTEAETWSTTDHRIVRFTHKWTIKNFDFYLSDSDQEEHPQINSPEFFSFNNEKLKFYLSLFPNGKTKENKKHFSLFLYLCACEKHAETRIRFKISILNARKAKFNYFTALRKVTIGNGFGWKEYISHQELKTKMPSLLPDNTLTLFCEIEAIVDSIKTSGMNEEDKQIESKLIDNLSKLFQSSKLSDVVFVAGKTSKTELRAHKAILGAQSAVFANMFEQDTKDPKECSIEIEDIEGDVCTEMLRFIYTCKVQNLDKLAEKLLVAADKYGLGQLKNICEKSIIANLNCDTVVSMLVIADKHSAKELRSKAIEYINENLPSIIETDNWKAIKDKPELYFEIFSKIIVENLKK